MNAVLDVAGALLRVGGAFFCFAAALGVVRFPDVLTRMHAATKPQVFGLLLVLSGVLLTLRSWDATLFGLMIVVLQIFTASVSSHTKSGPATATVRSSTLCTHGTTHP